MTKDVSSTMVSRFSDASLAYGILRLTFGVNIMFRGVMRLYITTDAFTADLLKQFSTTPMPTLPVVMLGHTLPYVETIIGLLLILGLATRGALVVGGLMMTALMFGIMVQMNFQIAFLQLSYALIFAILLAFRSYNLLSVDGMRGSTGD